LVAVWHVRFELRLGVDFPGSISSKIIGLAKATKPADLVRIVR
jgi:hypothetical protein